MIIINSASDLVKFWTYWKDKGLRKFELSNKFITWEIKDREKKKVQNITEKLVKQMKVNNELKYRQDMVMQLLVEKQSDQLYSGQK